MKFGALFEELLLELSGDEIYNKFYKNIDYKVFWEICMSDPKTVEQDGRIIKMGKYSKLLLDLYKRKQLNTEDLSSAKEYLIHIYEHNIPVNVNKIKGIPDLYELVKQYVIQKTPSLKEILKALDETEYEVLFNGEKWIIFKPLTEKSSCYLGVQSVWCTTWGPLSLNREYRDRSNQFETYSKKDTLYIIVNKENNEEKYQFNFAAKQFMNLENRQIDKTVFLDKNEEVKYFFFPSLIKDVSVEQLKLERKRIFVLSQNDKNKILDTFIEKIGNDNTIIKAILENDEELLQSNIIDDNVETIQLDDYYVTVTLKNISDEIMLVYDVLSYYESDLSEVGNRLYDDIVNGERIQWSDEYTEDIFKDILKKYYEKNKESIVSQSGYENFETFKNRYFKDFYEDEDIRESYIDTSIYKSVDDYIIRVKERIKEYEDFLNFYRYGYRSSTDIKLVKSNFIDFLSSNDITEINDMDHLIVEYTRANNLDGDYEPIYDYNLNTPTYDDDPENSSFVNKVDDFFEKIFGGMEQECTNATKKLNEIINKILKGSREFENDDVRIQINSPFVDCSDYTVDMTYKNKNTGKISRGKVKVDNITNYLTNYALFENYIKFKKLIK